MDTGYRIVSGGAVKGPNGERTRWWIRSNGVYELIWGADGYTGWTLSGNVFHDADGGESSYYVIERESIRDIHGPEEKLPWA